MLHRTFRKLAAAAALTCSALAAPTPAAADPGTWIYIGGGHLGTLPGNTDPVLELVDGVVHAAGGAACTPKTSRLTIHDLRYETWWNPDTRAIAYWWHNAGTAAVSSECANNVNVSVQINDYAPGGQPPVVRGTPATNSSNTPSGGLYSTTADASTWVIYYAPMSVYQRGSSLVEVKVTGSYYNTRARMTMSMGCVLSYASVTPTPVGPIVGARTPAEPCPA